LRRLARPTVLLMQHAGHFSSEFESRDQTFSGSLGDRLSWRYKKAWVYRSVRRADALLVQTRALADRIAQARLRSRERIVVVPHGPGQVSQTSARTCRRSTGTWRIGYISKFGVQKDFETLFRAARRLSENLVDIAESVLKRVPVKYVFAEGGATSAELVRRMKWSRLEVRHEWAPGVATLAVADQNPLWLTIKPGSYSWPEAWTRTA